MDRPVQCHTHQKRVEQVVQGYHSGKYRIKACALGFICGPRTIRSSTEEVAFITMEAQSMCLCFHL